MACACGASIEARQLTPDALAARCIAGAQCVIAVGWMHRNGKSHDNINSENFMFTSEDPKALLKVCIRRREHVIHRLGACERVMRRHGACVVCLVTAVQLGGYVTLPIEARSTKKVVRVASSLGAFLSATKTTLRKPGRGEGVTVARSAAEELDHQSSVKEKEARGESQSAGLCTACGCCLLLSSSLLVVVLAAHCIASCFNASNGWRTCQCRMASRVSRTKNVAKSRLRLLLALLRMLVKLSHA